MTSLKNLEYGKTSFLSKSNSSFIEEMYLRFIEKDPTLPESWKDYFKSLDEDLTSVAKEIEGPSWQPNKKKININIEKYKKELDTTVESLSSDINDQNSEQSKADSIKAITLIRAYRIRGHLIANLDPLGMMERKYLHELHPADHGFKKEDYNKKIYIGEYMDREYATINELLSFLRKTYCSKNGNKYMGISDPLEKKWFRERMEKKES